MTIEKGSAWGHQGVLGEGSPVCSTDAELRDLVVRALSSGGDVPDQVGLTGGDLWRTCGSPGGGLDRLHTQALVAPIDVVQVSFDGSVTWFVAHMVLRRSWWFGRVVGAMNAEFLGDWDVGTRTHPNDGRVDVYDVRMDAVQRWRAWRRLPTGRHVPHPGISVRRVKSIDIELDRAADLYLDGEPVARTRRVGLTVLPDALTVVV